MTKYQTVYEIVGNDELKERRLFFMRNKNRFWLVSAKSECDIVFHRVASVKKMLATARNGLNG